MKNIHIEINPAYSRSEASIRCLPASFQKGKLIYRGRNEVRFFEDAGRTFVVKRYKRPYFHQRFFYTFFGQSKARRAFDYALRLRTLGVDTPEPVAYIEEKDGCGLFSIGYFVSGYVADGNLRYLEQTVSSDRAEIVSRFAVFLAGLHEAGFLHGDLNLSNILCRCGEDGSYHFCVIDINRSLWGASFSRSQCLKNLMRITHDRTLLAEIVRAYALVRGWEPGSCCQEVLRLLGCYESKRENLYRLKVLLGLKKREVQ